MASSGLTTRFVCHVSTNIPSTRKGDIEVVVGGLGPDIEFSDADSSLYHGEIKSVPAGSSDSIKSGYIKRTGMAQKPSGLYQNEEGIVRKESKNDCKYMDGAKGVPTRRFAERILQWDWGREKRAVSTTSRPGFNLLQCREDPIWSSLGKLCSTQGYSVRQALTDSTFHFEYV